MPPHLRPLLPTHLRPLLPLLLALACGGAFAADAAPETNPELERAAKLRDEAKALRKQADDTLAAEERKCYDRFLVNRCIAQAKDARLATLSKARTLEAEASRTELAQKQRAAEESGRTRSDAPTEAAKPAPEGGFAIQPDPMADSTRRQREADAVRAKEAQQVERKQKDADKAKARAQAEAEAAGRADAAARDRARYEERIRKREAEKAEDAAKDAAKPAN
ncbi:hypothetical protein [Aromatoleum toluclasticum]|uniref:hypothetical protein n=1 Tax=Aromatoleum toluclasticum TaxID=92003 RepID=UPI001E4437BE|nr:hypothetical protein [Aromatoleum toluclasticum]